MAGNDLNANGRWNNTSSIGRTLLNEAVFKNGEAISGRELSTSSLSQSSLASQEVGSFNRPSIISTTNQYEASTQRKRSRVGEGLDEEGQIHKIDELLKKLQAIVDQIVKKGDKGKTILDKINLTELSKEICQSFASCLSVTTSATLKLSNLQEEKDRALKKVEGCLEEKVALQQQIIELQLKIAQNVTTVNTEFSRPQNGTYLQAALHTATSAITTKKALPIPILPETVKHAPSEHILLFRDKEKGTIKTKKEQDIFRNEIRDAIGEDNAKLITVIRPTKYGGYTVIFQNEEARDSALKCFRQNEMLSNIDVKSSCIVAPKKKLAKAVCREPPYDYPEEQFMRDLYSLKNLQFYQIPTAQREARIITTSNIGWIFEFSSTEAAACYAQGGRIRYGYGCEAKLEEFIPLQQCYKCCAFGHNANECLSNMAFCRLCGASGHAGKDCLKKDAKEQWSCINCRITNEAKGYKLPTDHGAAQLHKCPCALNQKMIRKEQLAASGVFTTPIIKETLIQKSELQLNSRREHSTSGHQIRNDSKKSKQHRSRSSKRQSSTTAKNTSTTSSSTSSDVITQEENTSSSSSSKVINVNRTSVQNGGQVRAFQVPRPRSIDGWKSVRRSWENVQYDQRGRGHEGKEGGTNSTSNLPFIESGNDNDTHMQ